MILLFGQHLTGSMADRQYPLHARVGSVGDFVQPPTLPPILGGVGGVYVRREKITEKHLEVDDDLILAIATLILIDSERHL